MNFVLFFYDRSKRKKERERRERKNAVNSDHYVLSATPKGSAQTLLGAIKCFAKKVQNVMYELNIVNKMKGK